MSDDESGVDEAVAFELETSSRVQKYRPIALEDLLKLTKFTRQEIRVMYRGFKQECPEGVVHEDTFKEIYAKFFPHGNSHLYAHYVFKAFDVNCNGAISFKDLMVTMSVLLRGTVYEKLKWTFKLYDINGDGCISRSELTQIVQSVHDLMGRKNQTDAPRKAKEQIDFIFRKLDLNDDGVVTLEEFIESCLKDEVITSALTIFNSYPAL